MFESQKVSIVIKDLAEGVSEFNNSHHLIHEVSCDTIEDSCKELMIIVELESESKLRLKDLPNCMVLASIRPDLELYPLSEVVIELISVLPVLT